VGHADESTRGHERKKLCAAYKFESVKLLVAIAHVMFKFHGLTHSSSSTVHEADDVFLREAENVVHKVSPLEQVMLPTIDVL